MQLSKVERENIGSTSSRNTCVNSLLAAAQSLLFQDLEGYQSSQRLNNNIRKQETQAINKTVPKYKKWFQQILLVATNA
jgi:hypothetical protein